MARKFVKLLFFGIMTPFKGGGMRVQKIIWAKKLVGGGQNFFQKWSKMVSKLVKSLFCHPGPSPLSSSSVTSRCHFTQENLTKKFSPWEMVWNSEKIGKITFWHPDPDPKSSKVRLSFVARRWTQLYVSLVSTTIWLPTPSDMNLDICYSNSK